MFIPEKEILILKEFKEKKVMTNNEISKYIACSIASVRHLRKKWKTYTSYNKNGMYYVLPDTPEFDKCGIWKYKGILFSQYGNLKKTLISIVRNSPNGLSGNEIGKILSLNPRSFLSHYIGINGILRKKTGNKFIYYSDDPVINKQQQKNREALLDVKENQLPADNISILILVDLIKHPNSKLTNIHKRLRKQNFDITIEMIKNLFHYYDLEKKTVDFQ
ncbi:MAG: hypothetical protein U9R21_03460 [Candidatus Thermoplasmatota archaeon]|nr:hypothetical protein [Candidatus Thermoplasmatota archaeon]